MEHLLEYKILSINNNKITQKVYRDEIHEGPVKSWIEAGHSFILEEDSDSGHGPRGNNIVKTWKEKHHLRHYFNCPGSPYWSPIEKCWRAPKGRVKRSLCLTHEDLVAEVQAGWDGLKQETINAWVNRIPTILKNTLELEGKMSGD